MSGGYFDYYDLTLKNEIDGEDFEDVEIQEMINDVLDLIHEYDWYKSCDTNQTEYRKAKKNFKKKWFGSPDRRLKTMFSAIINSLDECKTGIEDAFGDMTDDRNN